MDGCKAQSGSDFFFIQIGANDGVSFDGLYDWVTKNNARGLVLEPIQVYFDELSVNYDKHPQVVPVRLALHATESVVTMYRVDESVTSRSRETKGIASMDPDHHLRSAVDSESMIEEAVPCLSWGQLIEKFDVVRVDYLQVDTEGYDAEILDMVLSSLDRCRPSLIKFEHSVSANVMTPTILSSMTSRLIANGYNVVMSRHDAIAYTR